MCLRSLGGLSIPLNIFLYQEIQRLQAVLSKVGFMLKQLRLAIGGEVVMTDALQQCLDAIFEAKVPRMWLFTVAGDEFSWLLLSIGLWMSSLLLRDDQDRTWLLGGRPNCYWLTGFFNPQGRKMIQMHALSYDGNQPTDCSSVRNIHRYILLYLFHLSLPLIPPSLGMLTAMKQEVARRHQKDVVKWALDDIVYHTEVTHFEKVDHVKSAPAEGVYINGLFLEGAGWSKDQSMLLESEPKVLFVPLPVLFVSASLKPEEMKSRRDLYGVQGPYDCPCYKYRSRTDRFYVFMVTLKCTVDKNPAFWTLRAVGLLCNTD